MPLSIEPTPGSAASRGSSVQPTPAATIWRRVSMLVAFSSSRWSDAVRAADRQRLIAHAMAFFEQQHVLVAQLVLR